MADYRGHGYGKYGMVDSQHDGVPDRAYRQDKPAPMVDTAKRFTGDNRRKWASITARNGFNVNCDFIMAFWRDGIDYTKPLEHALRWLKTFNELNGIEECER